MSNNRNRQVFQAGRHIVMGLILIASAFLIAHYRKFGQWDLDVSTSYILAAILVIYGLFRIWRGTRELKERNVDDFIS